MKNKKWLSLVAAALMAVSLAACGSNGTAVYVQSVGELTAAGTIAPGDRFQGMVVSENVTEIKRDTDKSIAELLVKAGDDVTEGQELFSYDMDELQLNLDKKRLELEQLEATVENYQDQIAELEAQRDRASSSSQLQYTVQIQSLQVDLKEAELNIQAKETEIQQSEALLENAVVVSPISGRVQSINESGMDNYGNPAAYITIQQTGSYRVKGILGEQQLGGLMEGTRVKILSRTDESQFWLGTVTLIDYDNPTQGNSSNMYYYGMESDPMTSASRYPFYVAPDNTDGLVMGQHVYLELDTGDSGDTGLQLPSYYICYEESGEAYVWAERGGKLEKRTVSLGAYNAMTDAYEVLDGLTESDYIAFPDEELCRQGVPTTHNVSAVEAVSDGNLPADNFPMEELPMEGGVE